MTEPRTGGAPPDRPITVLLADDHAVLRQALRMLLGSHPDIAVIGDVGTGREAVESVEQNPPDVVVMDLVMPGLNGIEATRQIKRASPSTNVIVLSGFADEQQLLDSLRAGASGYLIKRSEVDELVLAIRAVHAGNRYFSEALGQGYNVARVEQQARQPESRPGVSMLTGREREVLQLVADGTTNQGIADQLGVSIKTVESHVGHIMDKLRARNRSDLIRQAIQLGMVQIESAELATRELPAEQPPADEPREDASSA